MKIHILKTIPAYFEDVRNDTKKAELRLNDRDFNKGDVLALMEYDQKYTGRFEIRRVSHIIKSGEWLADGYCMMSLDYTLPNDEEMIDLSVKLRNFDFSDDEHFL